MKDYLTESFAEYGDFVAYRFFNLHLYLIAHPQDVEHVLHTNHRNYTKVVANYGALKELVGEGLLTSEGPNWLRQRRLLQPSFVRHNLMGIGSLITDATLKMVKRWRPLSMRSQAFDLLAELSRLALEIFGRAFFSTDISKDAATIAEAWSAANEYFGQFNAGRFLPLVTTRLRVRSGTALRVLHRIADNIISERRRSKIEQKDLLHRIVGSQGGELAAGLVRDQVLTLMLTGYETTAAALCWTWYLLARTPEVQRALSAELLHSLHGKTPSVADLERLEYVRMVVEESLRLYPPAWLLLRSSIQDDEIRGCRIPKGSIVMISPYLTHRHPSFWYDPEQFLPERFGAALSERRHRFAYYPFGGGPRLCIGSELATMESRLILATVAQHYRLELVPGNKVEPQGLITLRPRYGLRVTAYPV